MIRRSSSASRLPFLPVVRSGALKMRASAALMQRQHEAMRNRYPDFRLVTGLPWLSVWEGELQPLSVAYKIRVVDHRGGNAGDFSYATHIPLVHVVSPRPARRPEAPDVPVPHLLGDDEAAEFPPLCLFFDDGRELQPGSLIADSVMLWATEWLYYYELWQVTGTFGGVEYQH